MGREPLRDVERRHRPVPGPPGPSRSAPRPRRGPGARRIGAVALGLALIGVAAGAAGRGGLPLAPEERRTLEAGGLSAGVADLSAAHRRGVRTALRARRAAGVSRARLESIAECESHGDPRAVSTDGSYRGKYQFHRATWRSMGGRGDPAKAPELEQDIRAAELLKASAGGAWPNCG